MGCLFHFPKTTSKNQFFGGRDLHSVQIPSGTCETHGSCLRNYPVDGVVEEAPWAAYGSTAQAKVLVMLFLRGKNDDPEMCLLFLWSNIFSKGTYLKKSIK